MVAAGTVIQHAAGWLAWLALAAIVTIVWVDDHRDRQRADAARPTSRADHRARGVGRGPAGRLHQPSRPPAGSSSQHGPRGQVRPAGPFLEKRWGTR